MPLIKRKPVELVPPPTAEDYADDQPVFYLKATGEIFLEFEDYIQRLTFYRQRLFQCELSGKINLTYFEAAKSERQQSTAVHRQFPEALKGPILKSVQFLVTGRIDNLVDLVYDRFKNRYFPNERLIVDIIGDKYFAQVRGVFPHRSLLRRHQEAANARIALEKKASSSSLKREGSESDSELSDAPPLDEMEGQSKAEVPVEDVIHAYGTDLNRDLSEVNKIDDPNDYIYAIQLEAPDGSSDFSNTLMEKRADSFSRDRLSFSKTILKKYIKECVVRDASIGSPWIVRPVLAQRYGIPTTPPAEIARKNDLIREGKLNKRRKALPEEEVDGKSKKRRKGKVPITEEEIKAQVEKEKELAEEEEKRKAEERRKRLIKYPIDDLLLDPISDRELKAKTKVEAPRRKERPVPSRDLLPAPKDIFEIFMNSYLFLQACGKPLALSPFTLDDFEAALRHQTHDPACHLISEVHGVLINAIVRENTNVKPPLALTVANTKGAAKGAPKLPSFEDEFDEAENETDEEEEEAEEIDELDSGASSIADTSVGDHEEDFSAEVKDEQANGAGNRVKGEDDVGVEDVFAASRKYGRGWERKVLRNEVFREGWEYSLCGVLSKRGEQSRFPRLLPILSHLSGIGKYTLPEEEQPKEEDDTKQITSSIIGEVYQTPVHRYTTLSFRDKVAIIYFLCEQAVMSKGVKAFFDECEHNLTELRKEKIDLSRARKKLAEDRAVFEGGSKKEEEAMENGDEAKENGKEVSDGDEEQEELEEVESIGEEDELASSAEAEEEYDSEADASVATDEQQQQQPTGRRSLGSRQEALRERAILREAEEAQRVAELAKAREEHKARLLENKQIANERKKLDEEEMRIIRREEAIEREFRQYSQAPRLAPLGRDRYLDKYWWFDGVGVGPLVNQYSQVMYSTGRLFVQGCSTEEWTLCSLGYEKGSRSLNERRKKEQTEEGILKPDEWAVYTEPEQIEELMAWLRSKGNRENALRSQMIKYRYYLGPGMQKRNHDLTGGWKDNVETRRSNRSKEGGANRLPYMLYRNALARGRD